MGGLHYHCGWSLYRDPFERLLLGYELVLAYMTVSMNVTPMTLHAMSIDCKLADYPSLTF